VKAWRLIIGIKLQNSNAYCVTYFTTKNIFISVGKVLFKIACIAFWFN